MTLEILTMFSQDDDIYDNYLENWVDAHVKEFIGSVKSIVKDETFLDEVAASLAWSHHNNEDCSKFFDHFGLDGDHALCYLDYTCPNDHYEYEISEAYQKYITNCLE